MLARQVVTEAMQFGFSSSVEMKDNRVLGPVDGVKQTGNLPRVFVGKDDEREGHGIWRRVFSALSNHAAFSAETDRQPVKARWNGIRGLKGSHCQARQKQAALLCWSCCRKSRPR